MKKLILFLLIIFFSHKINAYEIVKPFNIELGKEFKTDLKFRERINCSGYVFPNNVLSSVDFEHTCLVLETDNSDFPGAAVFVNKNPKVKNYKINDVLAVSIFGEPDNKTECIQFVKDMRNKYINNHGYKSITKEIKGEEFTYDTDLQIMVKKNFYDEHLWWYGIYKNLGIHVMCDSHKYISVEWILTDVKLKGISTDF